MPNLDYEFDKYTEKYQSEELERIRNFASSAHLGDEVILEIGSNRGRFLGRAASRWPARRLIGVEKRKKYADAGSKRLDDWDVENADLIHADVRHLVPVLFDRGQITDVFVPFPDPWWKTRHRKRRVIRDDFLDLLAPKMASKGNLWIRTDVAPFAEDMRDTLRDHSSFEVTDREDIPTEPLPDSTREEHLIREGLPIYLVYFQRK